MRSVTKLRTYLRLSYDLGILGLGSYKHGTRMVAEIGKFVGGWRRNRSLLGEQDADERGRTRI